MFFTADINNIKSNIKCVKQNVSTFIENEPNLNINSEENHLSYFPLKTESKLLAVESKLKN